MYEADDLKEELKDQSFFFSKDQKLGDINLYQVWEEEKWLL